MTRLDEAAPSRPRRPRLSDEVRDSVLADLVLSGEVSAGELLPTEAELCRRYGASRVTVRTALYSLRDAGFIDIQQGRGSTVLPRAHVLSSGLDRLSSLETFAANQGANVSSAHLEAEERALSADEARPLGLAPATIALVIKRVKVYDHDPVAWMIDYVPDGILPFTVIRREFNGSVLDVLLSHRDLAVEYSDCKVDAVPLPAHVAQELQTAPGTPALYLDELTRTKTGTIVNRSIAWLLPEYFNFTIRRRRPFGV